MVNDPVDMPFPWILTPTTKHCDFPGSNDLSDQEPGATLGGKALLGSSGGAVVKKNKSMQRNETGTSSTFPRASWVIGIPLGSPLDQ